MAPLSLPRHPPRTAAPIFQPVSRTSSGNAVDDHWQPLTTDSSSLLVYREGSRGGGRPFVSATPGILILSPLSSNPPSPSPSIINHSTTESLVVLLFPRLELWPPLFYLSMYRSQAFFLFPLDTQALTISAQLGFPANGDWAVPRTILLARPRNVEIFGRIDHRERDYLRNRSSQNDLLYHILFYIIHYKKKRKK